jgi:hypothetical protein
MTRRVRVAAPFALLGCVCVVAGGTVAAVTAPAPTEHSSWTAGYLVLVMGVAQVGLGCGLALVPERLPSVLVLGAQVVMWNVGNAAVVIGTLGSWIWLTDVGGGMLVATLVLSARATWNAGSLRWAWIAFRLFQAGVLDSVPIGLLLARHPPR